jgi:hypothetical protein
MDNHWYWCVKCPGCGQWIRAAYIGQAVTAAESAKAAISAPLPFSATCDKCGESAEYGRGELQARAFPEPPREDFRPLLPLLPN